MSQVEIREAEATSVREKEDTRKELAKQEFAQEAKRLREKAGLSQKQLGMMMGIEQAIISRIERAVYGITLDVVLSYAKTFNDDPYRLANIYWGVDTRSFADSNKQILDTIWNLLSTIYQPRPALFEPPPPPAREYPEGYTPEMNALKEGIDEKVDRRKGKEKPKERKPVRKTNPNPNPENKS